jgi:thymidylate kinase
VVWVDTPLSVCQERLAKRSDSGGDMNRLDEEKLSFHQKVYDGYKAQSLLDKNSQWLVLDGNKTPDELYNDFFEKLGGLWTKD